MNDTTFWDVPEPVRRSHPFEPVGWATWHHRAVSQWGPDTYGDPCRECGFSWELGVSDAKAVIASLPAQLADLLKDANGAEHHPDLAWTVTAYVSHIGDNLRIWAERVAGITLGGSMAVVSYDENLLATARTYESISLGGALWSLERATGGWLEAISMAAEDLAMVHPQRGEIQLGDVVNSNTHDAVHHLWDVRRSLASRRQGHDPGLREELA